MGGFIMCYLHMFKAIAMGNMLKDELCECAAVSQFQHLH